MNRERMFIDIFLDRVKQFPDKAAIVDMDGARETTYREFNDFSDRICGALKRSGVKKGDAVIVCMDRKMEYIASELAVLKCGAAFVPLSPEYPPERIRYIQEDCQAVQIIGEDFLRGALTAEASEAEPVSPSDPAFIIYTSGSTGNPKGIIHSHKSLSASVARHGSVLASTDADVHLCSSPFSFVVLCLDIYTPLSIGQTVHILSEEKRKDIRAVEDYIVSHHITVAFISPQMLRLFSVEDSDLRLVLTGSERVSNVTGHGYRLLNLYGCSETAVMATYFEVDKKYANTPIGRAAPGIKTVLLDGEGHEVPPGEEGELCVIGDLADRYIHLPEQSREVFIPQPDGTVLFHTRDICRELPDGNLVYVNRKDWMVKVNGQRVETGEIEVRMAALPGVENAVVKAFVDENGQNYLCGYYVAGTDMTEQILSALKETLPDYMLPRFFKRLDQLPKNANGKLDRKALLPPGIEEYKEAYEKPASEMERRLCQGFEEILHCGVTGRRDDFFRLGGDSINVLKLLEYLSDLPLTPEMVLKGRTPERIAGLLSEEQKTGIRKAAETGDTYPLTDSQLGVYLECVHAPESTMYNIPMYCVLPEGIDIPRFRDAVRKAVAGHISFAVNIRLDGGTPVMFLRPEFMEAALEEQRTADIKSLKAQFVRPFKLEGEPLYRMALYQCENRYYFLLDVHHLIFDGTSAAVLLDEISGIYRGELPKPEELSLTDMAAYEDSLKGTPAYAAAREYFRKKYEGAEAGDLLIRDYGETEARGGSKIRHALGAELSPMAVEQFARQNGISENTLFLGAFAYTIGKFSGGCQSFFCTVNNGRHTPRLARSTGMFVRTIPIACAWDEHTQVRDFLQGFQENFYELMGHDCMSFAELAKDYGISSDIMFVYQGEMFRGLSFDEGNCAAQILPTGDVQSDIVVMVIKGKGGYEISLEYRRELFREETMQGLLGMLRQVLWGMLSCERLEQIALASGSALQLLDRFNETEAEYDHTETVIDRFRKQAKALPENTAVVYRDKRFTYAQLDRITDALAAYLSKKGIGREQTVAVLIPRCEFMPIASIGISKAGAAYLPLDPTYPPDRLEFMMRDADARLLVADEALLPLVPGYSGEVLLTKEIPALPEAEALPEGPEPEDLFILLYTSGTTGTPKGCMIEHRNIAAFCHWYRRYFKMTPESKAAAYASYGFDANMMDTYPTLTAGAELHIIEEAIRLDLEALNGYFEEHGITHSFMTTQIGRAFATSVKHDALQHLSMGGETLVPFKPEGTTNYYNLYGPTETTVLTTAYPITARERDVPIGKPLSNLKLYVLDSVGRRVPAGVPGELCIAGYQVSRGYLNRPEKTAEVFTKNPFCSQPGYDRIYHTGDVVRFLPDGNIQFIGRRDGQVKVRGFRIELTEVEEIIRRFPGIRDATVAAFDDPSGGKYIAAYVTSDSPVDVDALNAFIEESKPPYMVPAVTMQIDEIPLNQNQKVNKRALPTPVRRQETVTPPQNDMQQKIFDCVAEVVGHTEFGTGTDIYRAGLTSIGVVKLNVLLSKAFGGAVIRNRDLKENNTVEKLEAFLGRTAAQPETLKRKADYALTKTQEGIFVESMSHPESTIYNIPLLIEMDDGIETDRLARALAEAVNAHPYIKTRLFMDDNGDIRQRRNDEERFGTEDIERITVDALDEIRETLVKPFRLLEERLFRIKIIRAERNYLYLELHHIISDGTSAQILLDDVSAAYAGAALCPEGYSAYEVSLTEEKARAGADYEQAEAYYQNLLEGCDADCLPAGDLRKTQKAQSGSLTRYGEYADAETVKAFCEANKLSLNGFFTAAFGLVLSKYSGKGTSVFTTIYNGRNDSRLERTVAMLVKTFPVLCEVTEKTGGHTVTEYVTETGTQLLGSMSNDLYSFGEISRRFGVGADVMFAYQGEAFAFDNLCGKPARLLDLRLDQVKAPLNLNVYLENGKIRCFLEYRSDQFSRVYAEGFLDAFDMAVSEMISKRTLREISILSGNARKELARFNDTKGEVEPLAAPALLERQVQLHPERTAVTAGNVRLTFAGLNARANRIAHSLIRRGVGRDDIVGLYMKRNVDVYAIRQGIMKSGGAFLSTEPDYPDDRISYIYRDAKARLVITTGELYEKRKALLDSLECEILLLEDLYKCENTENPQVKIEPDSLAYCIYTSGSTGKPKGVMIEHRNLMNLLQYHEKNVLAKDYVDNTSVFLALAAITFDVSVIEEMMPLFHGQSVAMATEEEIHNPLLLAEMIEAAGADMMKCTPSYMQTMLDFPQAAAALSRMNAIIIGAEPFPESLYDKMRRAGFQGKIFNSYGPTETTVTVTIDELDGERVTIGRPAGNTGIYMLDCYGNILPKFARGELTITGESVGRGYIGLEQQTKEKFITCQGEKAYKSGDIAYWNADGKIVHCGRSDNQVKLRGLRIELDEIETVMNRFGEIKRSVVLVKGEGGEQYLCGYYAADRPVDTETLKSYMKKYLTDYMIPSVFVHLTAMPMTHNGKVDKRGLPEPAAAEAARTGRAPANEMERKFCEIFALALGRESMFADDDFFLLGGTSLSASKIAMRCMTEKIDVVYSDVFEYSTPEKMAAYVSGMRSVREAAAPAAAEQAGEREPFYDVLQYNTSAHVGEISHGEIGNVLVSGATGFLGIHVVRTLLKNGSGKIYCLVRKGRQQSAEERLKMMLMYYFDDTFDDAFGGRLIPVDGDITDGNLKDSLADCDFDTVINCAACVKHFVRDDLLDRVNVRGVENLIEICMAGGERLVQVSTVSIAGESVDGHIPEECKLTENKLYFGQNLDNKYAETKFRAEKAVLEAVRKGLRGKIIRVGNLMGRESDGEFQINYGTNGFMKRLRAYSIIGCYPVGSMDAAAEFSPIDSTAEALVTLAGTPDRFTVFHAYNCHHVHMANLLDAMAQNGIHIETVDDAVFEARFQQMLGDESRNMEISGLIAYMNNGKTNRRYVGWDNSFTVKALYRLGFSWPLTAERYMNKAVRTLSTLGFFDEKET